MKPLPQGSDERLTPGFDVVFHREDVLPLAPLLGLGLADVLLQALGVFHAERHARLALQALELELGERCGPRPADRRPRPGVPWLAGIELPRRRPAGSDMLCDALVAEVAPRTQSLGVADDLRNRDVAALTRSKIGPMVAGLFPAAEQPMVLAMLERSVVFLHPGNIESVLRSAAWPSTAWSLANLYLLSVGCERLSREAPSIVGLSEETTCYVSPAYFSSQDEFADCIVHEAAHVFHNCKRATVGLEETRRRDYLLDIDYRKRETFAYACEACSCIVAEGGAAARRQASLQAHAAALRAPSGLMSAPVAYKQAAARAAGSNITGRTPGQGGSPALHTARQADASQGCCSRGSPAGR